MDNKNKPIRRNGPGSGHGPMGMMPGEKAKDFKGTMKTLYSYLKPFRFRIAVVFIFSIVSTVFSIVSPKILGKATDKIFEGLMSPLGIDFKALGLIVLFLVGLYLISFGFSFAQGFIMATVSQKITYNLREAMSAKIDRLPLKYFDSRTNGEIQSRFTNDIETLNQSLSQSITQIITSTVTIIGIIIMMFSINFFMTLVALLSLPISMILIKVIIGHSQKHFKNQQKYLGDANSHVEEMYNGHIIVQAFNRQEQSTEAFDDINDKLCESAFKSQFFSGMMQPLSGLVGNLSYVLICILGGKLALSGKVTIGNIQSFIQYIRSFNQPITMLANVANVLQSTAAAAERIFELLDEEEEVETYTEETRATIDFNNFKGDITFENVSFGYGDTPVIKDFNFSVKAGQRIAIVGPTGAGKTTIVKLLLRFYELHSGRILIDGVDIKNYSRKDLRDLFGMVLQDTWLYSGSVMDNIRYGNMNASDEEVKKAAKAAHIHHFIKTQPKGYDMEINEESSNISQGQKQLLTIARAILADNPIMILDEATSSVDTRTETLIQKAMANLMENRTSFIIAHRLSTIKDADEILVIDNGNIVEHGSHTQLLEKGGAYAKLYNSQF